MKIKEIFENLFMKKCEKCMNKCAWYNESSQGASK